MSGLLYKWWSLLLGLMAAIATAISAGLQSVSFEVGAWRCLVAFAVVWAFQWSLLTAWDILADGTPSPERVSSDTGGS